MASQAEIAAAGLRKTRPTAAAVALAPFKWYWTFARRKPLGGIGVIILLFAVVIAIFGPWIKPQDPLEIHARDLFHDPQWTHGFVLGTDHLGRDVMSRLMIGARSSISIALIGVITGTAIGFILGLYSGFYPDWRDTIISRFIDMKMAFPTLVLALAIVAVLGQSNRNVIIVIAVLQIAGTARVVRSVVLSTRTMEYVQAARALGASEMRLLWRHVAPQTFAPLLILTTAAFGIAIIVESSLSFLGLGTPPPNPAWGAMLSGPTLQNIERAPWNGVFPGLALTLLVFGFNLVGDALRDVLDPRLRR